MVTVAHDSWKAKAIKGDWESLLNDTQRPDIVNELIAVIWRVKALRALNRRVEAKKELQNAATGH